MRRGGNRPGAGRPKDTGRWGEQTQSVRIPLSLLDSVTDLLEKGGYRIPLYASYVPAGIPSLVGDDVERITDINELVLKRPAESFLLQAKGDSMINAGIQDGDYLLVDKSIEPANGKIVVAMIDGEATVKSFKRDRRGVIMLMPENDNYQPIFLSKDQALHISGVVTGVIRKL